MRDLGKKVSTIYSTTLNVLRTASIQCGGDTHSYECYGPWLDLAPQAANCAWERESQASVAVVTENNSEQNYLKKIDQLTNQISQLAEIVQRMQEPRSSDQRRRRRRGPTSSKRDGRNRSHSRKRNPKWTKFWYHFKLGDQGTQCRAIGANIAEIVRSDWWKTKKAIGECHKNRRSAVNAMIIDLWSHYLHTTFGRHWCRYIDISRFTYRSNIRIKARTLRW